MTGDQLVRDGCRLLSDHQRQDRLPPGRGNGGVPRPGRRHEKAHNKPRVKREPPPRVLYLDEPKPLCEHAQTMLLGLMSDSPRELREAWGLA